MYPRDIALEEQRLTKAVSLSGKDFLTCERSFMNGLIVSSVGEANFFSEWTGLI